MATRKKDVRSLLRKQLGKEAADALLNKLDKMAKKGAPASAIEKTLAEELALHIRAVVAASANKGIKSGTGQVGQIIRVGCEPIIWSRGSAAVGTYRKSSK
ncbi:MAG: hypothetical protein WBQ76_13855 [Candidatus Korobacteraceae bacterium]|jgi:hypothetical protein